VWSLPELQDLLDQWLIAEFSDRPAVCPGRPARLPLTA
jgi:hypothetical protein